MRLNPVDSKEFTCGGVPISEVDLKRSIKILSRRAAIKRATSVHLCNSYTLHLAQHDMRLREYLNSSSINLIDGTPIAWLGRAGGTRQLAAVRGPELLVSLLSDGRNWQAKHYFFGGDENTLSAIESRIRNEQPGNKIVGMESPPFSSIEDQAAIWDSAVERINNSGANYVWVGLGTPKQDYFVGSLGQRIDACTIAIGAAFDFYSGRKPEAPNLLHGSGFEWVFRLSSEPRRLVPRYIRCAHFSATELVKQTVRRSRGSDL